MSATPKNNENHHKAPKSERLNAREKPLVQSYVHAIDISIGALFSQYSRIPEPAYTQPPVTRVAAAAMEQTINTSTPQLQPTQSYYQAEAARQPAAKFDTAPAETPPAVNAGPDGRVPGELDMNAIYRTIEEARRNA